MNEGVKVSIAGIAFRLDAGAYEVLKAYLDRLEEGYAKRPEGDYRNSIKESISTKP